MNAYADLLRTPGVARIITAQLLARFPGGMISLGFLLHLEAIFDSYGAAGLVLAATSAGQALSGPLTSRWMGVWGMRPVLILTTAVSTVALLTVALVASVAPDLDVLIRSSVDPLLFLEFHRQFTHSLVFIPIGAALCAAPHEIQRCDAR